MVLPDRLIEAIKRRASARGQTITAYIGALVQRDLATDVDAAELSAFPAFQERLQQLERRVEQLERQGL